VWHPGQEWIWQPGGFGVFDPGINALSILTHIVPEAVRMKAAELFFPDNREAPIAAKLIMATASGAPVRAEFDFLQTGPQSWDTAVETSDGALLLGEGGNTLSMRGAEVAQNEYRTLYRHFVQLVGRGQSDVDLAPLRLVADAFLCRSRRTVEPFYDET
ncbi:MAG: galactose 1-dehydrogenase, partial [Erythrobacter sp.]